MNATMPAPDALERLPITLGYFRLMLRAFGDTSQARAAILAGTGVDEALLADPAADITLFQQLRQIDNLSALLGEGWPFLAPDLFGTAAHGAIGVAAITGPDAASALTVIARYGHARAPFVKRRLTLTATEWTVALQPSVPLSEAQWRTVNEVNFLGLCAVLGAVLGRPPRGARYRFTGPPPAHEDRVRAALGKGVSFGHVEASFSLSAAELRVRSPYSDPSLHARAVEELEGAMRRLAGPANLKVRVERLLITNPTGRLDAAAAASALGVSRRTLVRRLADAGCRYRDLLDGELRERAHRLLAAGAFTHAEISDRLGYADATSFSRACRRWFKGETSGLRTS
jgi:AraC-like DNA-binding protein